MVPGTPEAVSGLAFSGSVALVVLVFEKGYSVILLLISLTNHNEELRKIQSRKSGRKKCGLLVSLHICD
ncbi:MAG: hypothetical protein A4E41_00270 [Methanoregulaceae archaeon PtaU1.Bin066]|jgi:hypothetical protein|nr:MAG: hypothetical protein A4E41_00270 [Methanoregulaceae archaeon PtaU1.Bin066]